MARKQSGTRTGIYRSKFEAKFAEDSHDLNLQYEIDVIKYTIPATNHIYTPDFKYSENIWIECKGKFERIDRAKMEYIKEQHPDKIVIMIFMNPKLVLGKRLGTCLEWCKKRNIPAFGVKQTTELRNYLKELTQS